MSIFRIYPDRLHYKALSVPTEEILEKLGEQYPFHIDPTPRSYRSVWPGLRVDFYNSTGKKSANTLPDITVETGRLFLSSKAYDALKDILTPLGEFLPVTYDSRNGYIFNILAVAESVDGLNEKLSKKNAYGDLVALAFHEERMTGMPVFRTVFDDYFGVYCTGEFKDLVQKEHLTGIIFGMDLGNIFPPDPSAQCPDVH